MGKYGDVPVPYAMAVHGPEEEHAVIDVLKNHKTILGEKTLQFESKIAKTFGKRHGVMVNSGSSANLLAVELLRLPKGSEVITPVLTFSTTIAPLLQKGLKPIFVDVGLGDYQIQVDNIEDNITKNTRALMIPSLLGNVPDMNTLRQIANKHGLSFIEDSCDTLGATYDGKPTGAYSDISTTSFYGSHIITAAGGGGMLCFNKDDWNRRARILRGWGRSSAVTESEDIDSRFNTQINGIPYDSKFIFEEVAYNFLPLELSSAFGLEQFKKLVTFAKIRKANFNRLTKFFSKYKDIFSLPKQSDRVETSWLAYPLTIKKGASFTRRDITMYLEKNKVQTRPVFTGNILNQPAFKDIFKKSESSAYANADYIMKNAFVVGCHHGLSSKHLDKLEYLFEMFLGS